MTASVLPAPRPDARLVAPPRKPPIARLSATPNPLPRQNEQL